MPSPDFSRIARLYRWMEYASFGPMLHRTRTCHLPALLAARRALVLGDGDGRFLQALLRANPQVVVDAVDCSPGMVKLAARRISSSRISTSEDATSRVHWHCQDARSFLPTAAYDLITSHFFLDCFSTEEVAAMVAHFGQHLSPGGLWINSDFSLPTGWLRLPSLLLIRCLYLAFRWLSGLQTGRLPDDVLAFHSAGFVLRQRRLLVRGLLKSEIWASSPSTPNSTFCGQS